MPSSAKSPSTVVDSSSLPTIDGGKTDKVTAPSGQCRPASVLGMALEKEMTTSCLAGEKEEVELQAAASVRSSKPQSKPVSKSQSKSAAKNTAVPAAPRGGVTTTVTRRDRQAEEKSAKKETPATSKTTDRDDAEAGAAAGNHGGNGESRSKFRSCLLLLALSTRRGDRERHEEGLHEHGRPRRGPLARVLEKLKMGLFNRKKKEDANPYADAQVPYANPATPYQQARNNLAQGAPVGLPGRNVAAASNTPPPSYHSPSIASTSGGFGDDKYGNQGGYGSNRYDNASASPQGGYGGFDTDAGKGDLFGNASGRYVPPQPGNPSPASTAPSRFGGGQSNNALFGNAEERYNPYGNGQQSAPADDEFDGYGAPRELTEEEKEEQAVQDIKNEIKGVRQESKQSLARTLASAQRAIELGGATDARLAQQGERLTNTEKNLDAAMVHSRDAESKTKELKKLNGSMFMPAGGNPFTSRKRQEAADKAALERHRMERDTREQTRREGFNAQQQAEADWKGYAEQKPVRLLGSTGAANKNKYDFEGDEEDEQDEQTIDEGLDEVFNASQTLNVMAKNIGDRLVSQNQMLDRLQEKSDLVDDHVRMNREKLSRIR